jgi:serine phosphatase RsbU (regulator of sigma subunit)
MATSYPHDADNRMPRGPVPFATTAATGFFTWHIADGGIICDEEMFRLHGLPPDARPHFDTFLARVAREEMVPLLETLDGVVSKGGDFQVRYRVRDRAEQLRTLESRGRVVLDSTGAAAQLIGLTIDITEQVAAEESERERLRDQVATATRIRQLTTRLATAGTVAEIRAATQDALPIFDATSIIIAEADTTFRPLLLCGEQQVHDTTMSYENAAMEGKGPVSTALASGEPLLFRDSAELIARYPYVTTAFQQTGKTGAWAFLPLTGFLRVPAVCIVGYDEPRDFSPDDQALLVAAAGLLGQAVQRAALHDAEHRIATQLQARMLPGTPRFGVKIDAATRYEAAATGMFVGGDWYDALPLPDGSTVLVIGDVEGHDVQAAGTMGRLSTAVRAYTGEGHRLDQVLVRANGFLTELNTDVDNPLFATCTLVRVDPMTGTVSACRAGHIPPVVAVPGRRADILDAAVGLPLGVSDTATYETATYPLVPDTIMLLCTDGLLESRDGDLDNGLIRTRDVLNRYRTSRISELADELLTANRPDGPWPDDVALIAARLG